MKAIPYIFLFIFACQSNAQVADFDSVNFQRTDSIALAWKDENLTNLPALVDKLTANLTTDVTRFRAIYRWVCGNIANDYNLYAKNMRKRQRFKDDSLKLKTWNNRFKKIAFQKLIEDNKTICTGYAYLLKELSELADIDCEIVHGYARVSTTNMERLDAPNHSWNAVKLQGKWYLCDPTWASGLPNPETTRFEFQYNDGFFLTNPELFAINHYPVDKKWLLVDPTKHTFKNFLEAPVVYGKAYAMSSIPLAPTKMHNTLRKNEKISFHYKLLKPAKKEDISLLIDNGNSSKKIHPTSTTIDDQSLTLDYKFEKTGFYDVHLFIGTDLISTYTFRVKS